MKRNYFFNRRKVWPTIILLCCCLVVLAIALSPTFTPKAHGDDAWDSADSYFTENGTGPTILSQQDASANLATKVASEKSMDDRMAGPADGGAMPSKLNIPAIITPVADDVLPTGILQETLPLPTGWGSLYRIENSWQNIISGVRTTAYAGLIYDASISSQPDTSGNPAQGILIVSTYPSMSGDVSISGVSGEYRTSTRTGSLHITSATGPCLSLVSTTNVTYQFDVVSRSWQCLSNP